MIKSEGEDVFGFATCLEKKRIMTQWWQWSFSLKEREKSEDLNPHGEGQLKRNTSKRGGLARPKSGGAAQL